MNDALKLISIVTTILPFVMLIIAIVWWSDKRSKEILQRWAQNGELTLLLSEKRYFCTGPFFMNHFRSQMIFRIAVRDNAGTERSGWIRIGSWLGGVTSDTTRVIWDKQTSSLLRG